MSWANVPLNELGTIITGETPPTHNIENYGGSIPFVTPADLSFDSCNIITNTKVSVTEKGINKARLLPKNSVLVCCIGSLGKIGIAGTNLITNQQINAIVFDEKKVNPKYGFYACTRLKKVLETIAPATTVKIVKKSLFSELKIPVPPLQEQKKIVAILDEAQRLIEKRKEAIAKLDELVQSVFLDMFGDPIKNPKKINKVKLDKLGEWKSGGTPPRKKSEYYRGDIPWYSSGELNDTYIGDSIECISCKAIDETSAKLIEPGSLLLGMYDTAALKSSISTRDCSCNQAIAFSKLNKELASTLFVYYVIQLGRDHYKRQQRGVRQKNLNLTMIRDIEIILPSLEKQQEFVDVAEKIKQQKLNMQKSFVMLENNFQSLLQQAFKRELKVDTEIIA